MTPERPSGPSPAEVKRLVLDVEPKIFDLFDHHAVPSAEAGLVLRSSVDRLLRHGHRTESPRRLFLGLLEDGCAAFARSRDAEHPPEEGEDEDRAPDA